MCSRSRSALCVLAMALAGCGRSADLEIDLQRADGSVWFIGDARRRVDFCVLPNPTADAGGVRSTDCNLSDQVGGKVFESGERDSIGLFVPAQRPLRLFWLGYDPGECWALDVAAPARGHILVRLPAGNGALGVEGCVSPQCTILGCRPFQ